MGIKINKLELENVKRIKAVKIEPTANGLTVIGGKNNQGKTSVLDSIAWALGGEKYRPSSPQNKDSIIPPSLHIVLSNGMVVERKGKNSDLKVIDPEGNKGGQQLLNEFIEQLALDLPKFMESSSKEKAQTLLRIIGVGDKLAELEIQGKELYNQRQAIGQIADRKKKFADEQKYYPEAPKEIVAAAELISQQQEILAKNGENQRKRNNVASIRRNLSIVEVQMEQQEQKIKDEQAKLAELVNKMSAFKDDLRIAETSILDLLDESTEELENNISNIEEINRKVRINLDKDKAEEDALDYRNQYEKLTSEIADVRKAKTDLLSSAQLPLPGLSVDDGELIYNGQKWDNMSGSEQLIVSTAIVRKLNPNCGFVLLDKLEQMDVDTLNEFGKWLESEGLQAIATRVSTGGECSIVIEDGYAVEDTTVEPVAPAQQATNWKAGEF